ncbi:MAG TPA: protocatechuate 3,4-dioxygenase [Thermoanaerobaculia bacterium]|jgi:protocatechuate 3,4-dioxygenase beta subunit|nr:protocatechuate 3,4-dioxygenase [Thermoanaerobaculia bacterium]
MNRRELLTNGIAAAAAFATGLRGPNVVAQTLKKESLDLTPGDVCTLTCAATLGPCYYSGTTVRQDITEGKTGLPTLLSFLIVDADTCQPVQDATIDIWHTDNNGVYSAPINAMCNPNDALARQQTFLRGVQPTDTNGWAHFHSIYPGWYSGRTTHIHATIRRNNSEMVTTQFFFDDTLSDFIYRNHASYSHRPNKDTTNLSDNVIGGSTSRVKPFLFTPKLIDQKSLVALKVIAIRSVRTTCSA